MSKTTNRDAAPREADSAEHRLARLLETPFLARVVPHLPPETLHQLIRYRGLDACGEIVTSATPAQLNSLLELDLWRQARPGHDEQFDVDRFGEWLEVLVDTGTSIAARAVAAVDEHLVVAGLSRYVRVFDPGIFEPTAQSDDEPPERHESMREGGCIDGLDYEVGGYIVRARRADAWDAIVTLLIALDAEHGDYFQAVMQGCRRLSNSTSEIDGLDDLLLAPEQHVHDVTVEREGRRSRQGYTTPGDARAFLEMARQPRDPHTGPSPIVTAYFRAVEEAPESPHENTPSPKLERESFDIVMELLTDAGVMPERPRALLEAGDIDPQATTLSYLRRLMTFVADRHESAYFTRNRELAFLANTLLAGGSVQSRPFTPGEASDAAASICNLGLEYTSSPDSFLIDHDLVTAFEVGWAVLHRDVSLFATEQLIASVDQLHSVDREIQRGLVALRRSLVKQRKAGTPWRAREAAEILAMLDMTAWVGVLGLLDECPILPAALTAVVEGRTTTVSQTAFEFISTVAQIDEARIFVRKLPDLLSR